MRVVLAAALIFAFFSEAGMAQTSPWTRVVERREHAFSLDIPRGWNVRGGMFRQSATQAHPLVMLTSPGGGTKMIIGNIQQCNYTVLTPLGMQLGFHNEMVYSTPDGDPMWVRPYHPGRVFAQVYGMHWLAGQCRNVKLLGSRDRPDAVILGQPTPGVPQAATAGEAFFACEKDGRKYEAYMFSQTAISGTPQTGENWNADRSWGFLTPEGNGMAAGMVLGHIVGSVQEDQNWLSQQRERSWSVVQNTIQVMEAARQAQQNAMERTFRSSPVSRGSSSAAGPSEAQDEISRLISGFDEYTTASGERKTVQYGAASNWWSNDRGQTLGTQSTMSPGYDWTPMERVPLGQR
jgi:hypothetical protein